MPETILTARTDRVLTITLNRPEALNALSSTMMREVVEAVTTADADPGIGAVVITGSERAFAAGADIKEMVGLGLADVLEQDLAAAWQALDLIRTPLVAAVAGYALGGGCELAMLCDVLVAAEDARFGQPEITLATIPGIGGSQRLTRAIGKAKAMDLVLTGRMMDAAEAERSGLVSRVVPADQLAEVAAEVAATIASMSRPVTHLAKAAVNRAFETPLSEGVRFERTAFHATFALEDRVEGMRAFTEKRPPAFRHR
ncbi:enoyl-CoA hydratase [Desertihabitans brevis]|uniref:Probable enoyl-CoA hydratase echA8 n=1 Tax=Desertihabitans brevis TaxID=2268447 RepID=A0A367YUH7_9ACTN|nr:enoyl-CoA hydratase [Desertihabitans brevis]RCK69514.1 enoyl-CoA hydratase [Desertihabitans brevis]